MKHLMLVPMGVAALIAAPMAVEPTGHTGAVRGELTTELAGNAVFGSVNGEGTEATFSLELGAYSEHGAVVFSRRGADRPAVGRYPVRPSGSDLEEGDEFHALVSLGKMERPVGVFRAMNGWVTITRSTRDRIEGRYEIRAVGFLAADPDTEDREITVRGSFAATR